MIVDRLARAMTAAARLNLAVNRNPPMSVDLRQRIVDLGQKAAFAANRHGIEGQRAQVVLVLDISTSMNARRCERGP